MFLHAKEIRELGWSTFIRQMQRPLDINQAIQNIPHPSTLYLHRLARTGVPAPAMTAPWSRKQIRTVYTRGAHSSTLHQFKAFLYEDMLVMVKKKYWVVLPFNTVKHLPGLKLAPAGVVPQRTCRPRPIMDYTFTGVNQGSAPLAPMQAMQFGSTINRVLQRIAYANPAFGPVLRSNFDLSDGYYRVPLSPSAALQLAVVLPPLMGKQALIGIPLVLPMGWKYSLPFFCAYTETATDLANQQFSTMAHTCPHPLEATINSISVPVLQQCIHMKPIHCISLWLTRMFTWMISWASHNPAPRPKHNRQSSTALMPSSEPSTQRGS